MIASSSSSSSYNNGNNRTGTGEQRKPSTTATTATTLQATPVRCVARFRVKTNFGVEVEWCGILPLSVAQDIQSLKGVSLGCSLSFSSYTKQHTLNSVHYPSLIEVVRNGFTILSQHSQAVLSVENVLRLLGEPYIGNVDFPSAYRAARALDAGRGSYSAAALQRNAAAEKAKAEVFAAIDEMRYPPLPRAPVKLDGRSGRLKVVHMGAPPTQFVKSEQPQSQSQQLDNIKYEEVEEAEEQKPLQHYGHYGPTLMVADNDYASPSDESDTDAVVEDDDTSTSME